MRTSSSCLFLAVAALTACHRDVPSLSPAPSASPPVTPRFAPVVDSVLTESVHTTVRREGAPGVREAELTTTTRFASSEGAWVLTQRVTRARYLQDGQPVHSLVDDVLREVVLRLRLAADGTFVRLEEPEAALATLRERAPAGLDVSALEDVLAPEALEARTRGEWELKYGGIFGRTLEPRQRGYSVGTLPLGGREVTYLLARTFTGTRLTPHGEALVFSLSCLGPPGDTSPQAVRDTLQLAGSPVLTPGVECDGEQWLGAGRFLPVSRTFTLRAAVDAENWTWATRSALESVRAPEEEQP